MFAKRVFDFLASLILLIISIPFIIVILLLHKIYMPGDIFFKQYRIGRYQKPFYLYKFRTMEELPMASEGRFDPGDSSRVTKLGSFLRKYKLDEIPQLINVIKGDMSIVGPRPEIKRWTEIYTEKWEKILAHKPGITDTAAIMYRNEENILAESANPEETYRDIILPRKLDLSIDYVQNRTFFGDLKIIFRTILTVIFR